MTFDYAALFRRAKAKARAQHKRGVFGEGECLQRVRELVIVGPKFLTAARAYDGAEFKHPTSNPDDAPAGSMGFYKGGRIRKLSDGKREAAGHIVYVLGHGACESTDFVNLGGFGTCNMVDIEKRWGLKFVGWTEDLNGVRIMPAPAPEPRIPPTPAPVVKAAPVTPYDEAYALAEQIVALGKHVQKKYKARRRLIDTVDGLLHGDHPVPFPASRKKAK